MKTRHGTVYAVIDRVANILIGGLQIHKHPAPAVRTFTDAATMEGSIIALHPADFDLVQLGHILEDHTIEPEFEIILTGAAWLASQTQEPKLVKGA